MSTQPTNPPKNPTVKNAITALALFGFVGAVYYTSIAKIKEGVSLHYFMTPVGQAHYHGARILFRMISRRLSKRRRRRLPTVRPPRRLRMQQGLLVLP